MTAAAGLLLGLVWSQAPAQPAEDALVTGALQALVKVLNRSVDTYHCAPLARIAPPGAGASRDGSRLRSYLEGRLARYWDASVPVREYGAASGLYAGIEPVTCRHFGGVGDAWALIRIRLPRGLAFLDVRRERPPAEEVPRFSPAVAARLRAAACAAGDPSALVVGLESQACREIALASLARLAVAAILADLPASRFVACDRPEDGAFILLDAARARLGEAALFTKDVPLADSLASERLMIRELYVRARRAGSSRVPPWAELSGPVPPDEMKLWMEEHLWSCGARPDERLP